MKNLSAFLIVFSIILSVSNVFADATENSKEEINSNCRNNEYAAIPKTIFNTSTLSYELTATCRPAHCTIMVDRSFGSTYSIYRAVGEFEQGGNAFSYLSILEKKITGKGNALKAGKDLVDSGVCSSAKIGSIYNENPMFKLIK